MSNKKTDKNSKSAKKVMKHVKTMHISKKTHTKSVRTAPKSLKLKVKIKAKLSAGQLLKKARDSSMKRSENAKSKKLIAQKLDEQTKKDRHLDEVKKIGALVENEALLSNVSNGVGTGAVDILRTLVEAPKTDESIAEKLNIKVNDVRRMLNVMNSYSIVRYDVNKDNKGWLIFTWRIDSEKLSEYVMTISKETVVVETTLPGNCNDFFVCKKCYTKEKTVLPFDSAFESDFSCVSCGKPFALLSREETVALFKTVEA